MSQADALKLARGIIESYAADIRAGIEAGTIPAGFCQGEIYTDALPWIDREEAREDEEARDPFRTPDECGL